MKMNKLPPQERLHELLRYDNESGCFYWKKKSSPAHNVNWNKPAGSTNKRGYSQLRIDGITYYLHRLVYAYHFGEIPDNLVVDHIDGNTQNNKIENLQAISVHENTTKMRANSKNTSGYRGVQFDKRQGKWVARIYFMGKVKHFGSFENKIDAAHAYDRAAVQIHGKFAVRNFPDSIETRLN